MKGRTIGAALIAALLFLVIMGVSAYAGTDVGPAGIAVSTQGGSGYTPFGGVRLQAIGSLNSNDPDELLGVAGLSPSTNRISANFTFTSLSLNGNAGSRSGDCTGNFRFGTLSAPASNGVSFAWDPAADTLTSRLVTPTLDCTLVFAHVAQELANAQGGTLADAQAALGDVNALRIMVDAHQAGTTVVLRGATVDGNVALPTFDPGAGTSQEWFGTGYDFDAPNGFSLSGSLDLGGTFGTCATTCALEIGFGHLASVDQPPVVTDHAADVSGDEGSALSTHGSFTDPDGDPLTIAASGAGSIADHGDGSWSWQLVPADDGQGTVTVTASDGRGATATDTFTWDAANVPPTIVSLTPSVATTVTGSDVTWTAAATDPGTADTFTWWFDDGAGVPGGLTTTFTRSYASCGSHPLTATVADDDGGSDTATSATSVSVADATMLPPLGARAARPVRPGSVVPVRVWIGCDGVFWSGLHPTVAVAGGGALAPATSPDGGTDATMREVDGAYLFDLRVPDALGAAPLRTGDRLTIVVEPFGPSGGTVSATVQVRA
ncbi:MAG: Ig-like domain-containing protein [Planctomycetaceae bacterium]